MGRASCVEAPVKAGLAASETGQARSLHRAALGAMHWHTDGVEPAADEYLGMGFAAEMPRQRAAGRLKAPFVDGQFLVTALDHKPMDRAGGQGSADFTLEFTQGRHSRR